MWEVGPFIADGAAVSDIVEKLSNELFVRVSS